jgi:hypothetical protein
MLAAETGRAGLACLSGERHVGIDSRTYYFIETRQVA